METLNIKLTQKFSNLITLLYHSEFDFKIVYTRETYLLCYLYSSDDKDQDL